MLKSKNVFVLWRTHFSFLFHKIQVKFYSGFSHKYLLHRKRLTSLHRKRLTSLHRKRLTSLHRKRLTSLHRKRLTRSISCVIPLARRSYSAEQNSGCSMARSISTKAQYMSDPKMSRPVERSSIGRVSRQV
jgi:hypothetical protein